MAMIQLYQAQQRDNFTELARELNLIYYASQAADLMEFEDIAELHEAVKRAMEICLHAGVTLEGNFKRIYKCSYDGILYDWKLSVLGYRLVCLNGSPANPNTAQMQIDLLKSQALHS